MPPAAATWSRSAATAPPERSTTVTSPPAASRWAAAMVSSADQPASVPPATSTRSIPAGSATAYQRFWLSKASRRDCHSLSLPGVLGLPGEQAALLVGAEPLDPQPFGADPGPQHPLALPDREAGQRGGHQAGGDGRRGDERRAASRRRRRPPARSAPRSPRRSRASAVCAMSFSSRRCAASQSADSCCRSGGTGRRGGGPGSACGAAYCQPRCISTADGSGAAGSPGDPGARVTAWLRAAAGRAPPARVSLAGTAANEP